MKPFPLQALSVLHPSCIVEIIKGEKLPKGGFIWEIKNEVKPIDLYCYLYARFGMPNGLQNFLRNDSSDNLIHWEWTFATDDGLILIQGHNFRTEVHCMGEFNESEYQRSDFIDQIKNDFAAHGKRMAEVRKSTLEKWAQFVNPYDRIKSAIDTLVAELDALDLDADAYRTTDLAELRTEYDREAWKDMARRFSKGFGICFGIRSMLPVMAEAFVNLLLFLLARPEIKSDARLFENLIRQPIDIRIKSLHINCVGIASAVDYTTEPCKNYHSLVNERNDLLHGNVAIEKLTFDEVYFNKNVPVFVEYRSVWERSFGVGLESVGLHKVKDEMTVVSSFIAYVLERLTPKVREQVEMLMENRDLGYNYANKRVGLLFSKRLVDFRLVKQEDST